MSSNIDIGGPGASGACWNFWSMAVFFEEPGLRPGRVFLDYGCSPVNSGRCHVVLPTSFCMQM